ncbi:MAG: M14 family zinc carboxypeptidase [Planctomycetota bacterium]
MHASRSSRRPLGAALVFTAAMAASAPAQVALNDLSESGAVFTFAQGPDAITVRLSPTAAQDVRDFEVSGATRGAPVRFVVAPPVPADLQPQMLEGDFAWQPVAWTTDDEGRAHFAVTPSQARCVVRLGPLADADAPYYTYNRFVSYIEPVLGLPAAQATRIGSTRQGRPLYRLLIDAPSPVEKKTVVMVVRQHGNEDGSSYVLEGALDLLLGRGGQTPEPELLEQVRWVIYPLANPDGAVANQRYNSRGIDLNRNWLRTGAQAGQEPEIFAVQSDIEDFQERYGVHIIGDHHGWASGVHGGFRYAQGQGVSFVSVPEHREARKDTTVIERWDPTQSSWTENGGTTGMLRSEMFLRYGFLVHTPEYDDLLSTATEFRAKGRAWVRAMHDTLYAPRFTDAAGQPLATARGGAMLYVTVDDDDENVSSSTVEAVRVVVRAPITGDTESLTLAETGPDTGVFRNLFPLPLLFAPGRPDDGRLQAAPGTRIRATYVDDDYGRDKSSASLPVRPADR